MGRINEKRIIRGVNNPGEWCDFRPLLHSLRQLFTSKVSVA